jgi:Fe-S-cluster-containing hydrogenase component 2
MDYYKFKESNCKNCHKCIRHCQVKAISFSKNQAHIVPDECLLCGGCFVTCPQNANEIRDDLPTAKLLLQSGAAASAPAAPSSAAAVPGVSFASLRDTLKKIGFADAQETALGATIVKKRYEQIIQENQQQVILTTCCHSVNRLVQIHFPSAIFFKNKNNKKGGRTPPRYSPPSAVFRYPPQRGHPVTPRSFVAI